MQTEFVATVGGADGPTAFYTTVMIARPVIIAAGLCVAVLVTLGLWFFLKPK